MNWYGEKQTYRTEDANSTTSYRLLIVNIYLSNLSKEFI